MKKTKDCHDSEKMVTAEEFFLMPYLEQSVSELSAGELKAIIEKSVRDATEDFKKHLE